LEVTHAAQFPREVIEIADQFSPVMIEALCDELVALSDRNGRLFLIELGAARETAVRL
jgi:hypothetical protein